MRPELPGRLAKRVEGRLVCPGCEATEEKVTGGAGMRCGGGGRGEEER